MGGYHKHWWGDLDGSNAPRRGEEFDSGEGRWRPETAYRYEEWPMESLMGGDGIIYCCSHRGEFVAVERNEWWVAAKLPESACERNVVMMGWAKDWVALLMTAEGGNGEVLVAYALEMKEKERQPAAAWWKLEVPPEFRGIARCGCCAEI
ncbi:hypothetical protein AXF42_Ash009422 [Apostasia shenzhenica]|uniref:F-box/kelch-repeat protein n=1 Tax=Apostasia shenzhenica TaxID=1088818 RepID=A0A2I0B8T1_9ASPA|nr:hypothetical protein AXF42_Ash009422 [Apostasia shenzhenica]